VSATRVVEVAPERYPGWRERFDAANAGKHEPQRVVAIDRFAHDPVGLVLVRRGGYAVGLAARGTLVGSKIGTAHVQGRTKKGGWSQQRYARRRSHQADEVVERARERVVQILLGAGVTGIGVGGDRALVAQLLEDPRLAPLRELPRRELYDLPDPTRQVLQTALTRTVAVRVSIVDP
jgi:hypothetical protein